MHLTRTMDLIKNLFLLAMTRLFVFVCAASGMFTEERGIPRGRDREIKGEEDGKQRKKERERESLGAVSNTFYDCSTQVFVTSLRVLSRKKKGDGDTNCSRCLSCEEQPESHNVRCAVDKPRRGAWENFPCAMRENESCRGIELRETIALCFYRHRHIYFHSPTSRSMSRSFSVRIRCMCLEMNIMKSWPSTLGPQDHGKTWEHANSLYVQVQTLMYIWN